ncbi:MAG: SufS family cysteine desulfurase [Planctomyces sp.]
MQEINSELIASIANRLFQQLPGVPPRTSGATVPEIPGSMTNPPGLQAVTSAGVPFAPVSSGQISDPSILTQSFRGNPGFSSSLPEFPGATSRAIPGLPSGDQRLPATEESTALRGENPDGLSQFISRIRAVQMGGQPGLCDDDPALQGLRSRFAATAQKEQTSRDFNVTSIRKDFPILNQKINGHPLIWLDNAATTQKPNIVIDTIAQFYRSDNSNIHRAAHTLAARATDAYEGARKKIQQFLGAGSTDEIIFVRGTTEGINLVARTFGSKFLQPGDEILLSILEHHANIVPWQMVARERGAMIRVIPVNDRGEIQMDEYQRLLGPKTKLVALTQASNSLGTILPVTEMTQMAKRYGARVLIDGAQSVAHIPVNVKEMDCDFFVFSGHKIFGPTGIGAVYGRKELLELLPPWQGGGNMIRDVTFEETIFQQPPARFEAGTPNVADAVGLGAALDYVNRLGLKNIAHYEHELLLHGTELLNQIDGLQLIGKAREKVGVLSFVLRGFSTEEVGRRLDQEGIAVRAGHHCSQPSLRRFGTETTVRPSLSLYNTREELEHLAAAVRRIQTRSVSVSGFRDI